MAPGRYYVYAVIDTAADPAAALLSVWHSRQMAREAMREHGAAQAAPQLRVRRAKLTLFET